ncbi:MAG: hypothetical protein ACLGHQ_08835 [Acidimicrobiia bacterium]
MMRTLGIVVGLVTLVAAAVLALAAVLSLSNQTSWTDLAVGDCFDLAGAIADADGDLAAVMAVDTMACDEPHDAQVVAIGELNPDGDREYPDDQALFAEVDAACLARVPDRVDPGTYGIVPIGPDERTWQGRSGRFACVAVVVGGGTVTGSALE